MSEDNRCDIKCSNRISALEEAFTRDDLGKPDFHLHRKYHLKGIKNDEKREEVTDSITSHIIAWSIGIILSMIGAYFGFK